MDWHRNSWKASPGVEDGFHVPSISNDWPYERSVNASRPYSASAHPSSQWAERNRHPGQATPLGQPGFIPHDNGGSEKPVNGTGTGRTIIVRGEEIGIVLVVLLLWVGAIVMFFNRWGKIRMLEPYQPKFCEDHRPSCPMAEVTSIQQYPVSLLFHVISIFELIDDLEALNHLASVSSEQEK